MSPALTAVVQPGTLDAKVGEGKQLSTKIKTRLSKVSEGWKLESFGLAATKLGSAAARLTLETEAQGKYWKQIADLKTRGWTISRLPADSRAIGVHFGFSESSSQFRARGFALLQQDGNGDLEFDSRIPPKQVGPIRFVVKRNGVETGSFLTPVIADSTGSDMNSQLVRARDSLFEEELFYEINREARLIANQNVQTQAKAVEAFISEDFSIKILQPGSRYNHNSSGTDDELAQFVALSSRFLLTAEHTRSLARRSQGPAPMLLSPPGIPEYAILRPIITHLRHQDCMAQISKLYGSIASSFEQAGIPLSISIEQKLADTDVTSQVSILRGPARSSLTLNFNSERTITIDLETFLGPPTYGTIYKSEGIKHSFGQTPQTEMHDLDEVKEFLEHELGLELVSVVEEIGKGNKTDDLNWSLARPQSGDFLIKKGDKKVGKISVIVEVGKLIMDMAHTGRAASNKKARFVWTEKGCWSSIETSDSTSKKTLKDIVGEINKNFGS